MTLPQVVIIGAGMTGSLLAMMVKDMGVSVRVVEKSKGAGGRMSTHRLRGDKGREGPVLGRADMGAQYITTRTPEDHAILGPLYGSLLSAGVLQPFHGQVNGPNPYGAAGPEVRHYTAPLGLQAVAEHFLKQSGAEVQWDAALRSLVLQPEGGVIVELGSGSGGQEPVALSSPEPLSVVVLTQPVQQVLGSSKFGLGGNFMQGVDPGLSADLSKVEYSSRFAVAFYFDASQFSWPHPWTAHYFDKGDVRYVSHDSGKRGASEESMVSIVVHSGVPLGIELQDDTAPYDAAAARLRTDLEQKLPEIPWAKAASVKVQKWLYSQVYKGIGAKRPSPDWVWDAGDGGFPGCVELFRTEGTLGLLAGDAMAPASNFEGCVFSAFRAAEAVRAHLQRVGAGGGAADGLQPKSDL